MEKQLSLVRQKYMGKLLTPTKVNTDKDLLKLNRMFEEYFGFGCFMINIINDRQVNAFTIPVSARIDAVNANIDDLIVTKNGYKFKKEADYATIVSIYSGMIFNEDFDDEEIMAVILHEIGHNFQAAISNHNAALNSFCTTFRFLLNMQSGVGIIFEIMQTNGVAKAYYKFINNLREKDSTLCIIPIIKNTIVGAVNFGARTLYDVLNLISLGTITFGSIANTFINKLRNPVGLILLPFNYKNERLADNFATMYGYGAATMSVQRKFSFEGADYNTVMGKVNKIPVLSTLIHLNNLPAEIVISAFDEHPSGVIRAKDQLDLLKYEASKSDLDPKMKKCILNDIKECEKYMYKFTDTSGSVKDPYLAKKIYYKLLVDVTGSKELKDLLFDRKSEKRFEDYDNLFKQKL